MSKDVIFRIREVFAGTLDVAEFWIEDDTYEGSETYATLSGLYEAALDACVEIERLQKENDKLRTDLAALKVRG